MAADLAHVAPRDPTLDLIQQIKDKHRQEQGIEVPLSMQGAGLERSSRVGGGGGVSGGGVSGGGETGAKLTIGPGKDESGVAKFGVATVTKIKAKRKRKAGADASDASAKKAAGTPSSSVEATGAETEEVRSGCGKTCRCRLD